MLPVLVFAGSLICLANLLGLALFILAHRRQAARQSDLLQQTRGDFQEAINQILDRYQSLRERLDSEQTEGEDEVTEREPEFQTVGFASEDLRHAPRQLGGGMNFSRRALVLRLHRRGESPLRIAQSLGLPQAEVDLVLKLHVGALT
jgi:hypothetical protein